MGPEWVSTAPCMMDTYSLYMNLETVVTDGSTWLPRPVAVVLPETTQQVQEIMRFCNKAHLMTKPLSTGFHAVCAASRDRVIILDLKRMDKIIDIDVKNQVAIVEPYVRAIDLHHEHRALRQVRGRGDGYPSLGSWWRLHRAMVDGRCLEHRPSSMETDP